MEFLVIKSASYWTVPGVVFVGILIAIFALNLLSIRKEKIILEEDFL